MSSSTESLLDLLQKKTRIDLTRLTVWLAQKFPDREDLHITELLTPKTGFSALTLLLKLAYAREGKACTDAVALRIEQPGHDIFLDTDISRQGEMMRALARHGLRAPAVIGIEQDRSVLGGQFLVTTYIQGEGLPQHPSYHVAGLLHDLPPEGRRLLWSDAVRSIAGIHQLNWQDGFTFLNRPKYGAPGLSQYLGWLRAWHAEASHGQPHAVLDHGLTYLADHQPETDEVAVLWGDSNVGNMLFERTGHVAAMLDFEAAALGPGEIDLGWWFYMDDMLSFGVPKLEGLPSRAEQIALYESIRGRPVHALEYYEILAGVRMALVMVRTVDRLINANALPKNSRAAISNPIVEVLARRLNIPAEPTGADYMAMVQSMNAR